MTKEDVELSAIQKIIEALTRLDEKERTRIIMSNEVRNGAADFRHERTTAFAFITHPEAGQFITDKPAISAQTTPTTSMTCRVDAPRTLDFRDTRTLRQYTNCYINSWISAG